MLRLALLRQPRCLLLTRHLFGGTKAILKIQAEGCYDTITHIQAAAGKRHTVLTWTDAIVNAKKVVHAPSSLLNVRAMLSWRLSTTAFMQAFRLAMAGHPLLSIMKDCFLERNGHTIRPLIVLLMAKALGSHLPPAVTRPNDMWEDGILKSQKALAEITEMIHVASLIHEGVVDLTRHPDSLTRPSEAAFYGNKLSVLTGDFLLAKASVSLAQLQNVDVVAHMSNAIALFIEGQSMLSAPVAVEGYNTAAQRVEHEMYLRTGSLIALSCRAVGILGGVSKSLEEVAYMAGKHIAIAYQLILDLQAYQDAVRLRSRPLVFLAPVVFAAQLYPGELLPLVNTRSPVTEQ
eukprot:Ihof_evm1s234 gene=Ihof_evmTU1s234